MIEDFDHSGRFRFYRIHQRASTDDCLMPPVLTVSFHFGWNGVCCQISLYILVFWPLDEPPIVARSRLQAQYLSKGFGQCPDEYTKVFSHKGLNYLAQMQSKPWSYGFDPTVVAIEAPCLNALSFHLHRLPESFYDDGAVATTVPLSLLLVSVLCNSVEPDI